MNTAVDCLVAVVYAALVAGTGALAVVDAREKRLPNRIVFPLYGIGAVGLPLASWLGDSWPRLVIAAAAGALMYGLFWLFWFFGPMGFGDVKLVGLLGMFLGWVGPRVAVDGLLLGMLAASFVSIVRMLLRKATFKSELAYGPYLIAGAWAALLLGLVTRST